MINISESFTIGYDQADGTDTACLTVVKRLSKDRLTVANTFFGEEAAELYKKLTETRPQAPQNK